MPERLECPVCLGVRLQATAIGGDAPFELDHCDRCGGVWFEQGEVEQLRRRGRKGLWTHFARHCVQHRMTCRGCDARLHRDAERCPGCGWKNMLDCPSCARPMERETTTGLHLDVCRACRGVWFDNHELEEIWRVALAVAAPAAGHHALSIDPGPLNGLDTAADIVFYAPDVVRAAGGLVEAASDLPPVAASSFEVVTALVEVGGALAGSVVEVLGAVLELIFGLFEGL